MEFLDNILTKHSSLLLHAIHSLFYWRILKTTIFSYGFKIPHEKIHETRKLEYIDEYHLVDQKNVGRKPDKTSNMRKLKFMPRNLD
jgi:hypothetical protein